MSAAPISHVEFNIERQALELAAPTTWAAIDRGSSLTKMVFTAKDANSGNSAVSDRYVTLHCVTFTNSDFEAGLCFLKERALLPAKGKIRVTGIGDEKYRALIETALGLEAEFMDEFVTAFRGVHFLMSHVEDRASLFYPEIPPDPAMEITNFAPMEARVASVREDYSSNNGPDPDALFPCIFLSVGSAVTSVLITKDGKIKTAGVTVTGGKSLLGLGKALVGTADYDELTELASNGKCGNVDTTAGDFIENCGPDSPYGYFPPQLPLFPLGKMSERDDALNSYSQEDRAISVIRLLCEEWANLYISAVAREKVTRVVIGGSGVRAAVVRKAVEMAGTVFLPGIFDIKFLRTECSGAIGAMIAGSEDMKKYMVQA